MKSSDQIKNSSLERFKKKKNSKLGHEPIRGKFHEHFPFQGSKGFEQT